MDVLIAGAVLVIILPLFITVAVLLALDGSGNGVFYRARRVGRGGREINVLKFRKMRDEAGPAITAGEDPRFTRIGKVLAATKLDELPQLLNVLGGHMSLVGPRPEDPRFVAMHQQAFATILTVRPGITGASQLAYAREAEILDGGDPVSDYVERVLPRKLEIDAHYVAVKSVVCDIRLLCWTAVAMILRRDVAVHRDTLHCSLRSRQPAMAPRTQASTGRVVAGIGARDMSPSLLLPPGSSTGGHGSSTVVAAHSAEPGRPREPVAIQPMSQVHYGTVAVVSAAPTVIER